MGGRGGKYGDNDGGRSNTMPVNRDIVDVLQQVHTESVDESLADEDPGVDAERDARRRDEVSVERRCGAEEVCCCKARRKDQTGSWDVLQNKGHARSRS